MSKTENATPSKFTKSQSIFIGVFTTLFSGIVLHYVLTGDATTNTLDIPFLPYIISLFAGIAVARVVSSIKQPNAEVDAES